MTGRGRPFLRSRRLVVLLAALFTLALAIGVGALVFGSTRDVPPPRPVANRAFLSSLTPDRPAVVWAVGDGANGSDSARALARRIAADGPDRMLYLGDVYDNGSIEDFREGYDTVYGRLAPITAPTPGNHEWPAHLQGYDRYWRIRTGAPTPPWYAFRVGGWQLISLNSEAPHSPGSPQLRWLASELRRTRGTCTLAFWHRPLQSAGRNGDQADVAPLWNALRGQAKLVINGHDHNLQRLRPRDGITELVAGAGGKNHYPLKRDKRVIFGDDHHDGALRIALGPGRAELSFVAADGTRLDQSTTRCETDRGLTPGGRRATRRETSVPTAGDSGPHDR